MQDSIVSPNESRKISVPFYIALFFVPLISYWFLFRQGYSTVSRVVGGVWLACVLLLSVVDSQSQVDTSVSQVEKNVEITSPYPDGWDELIVLNRGNERNMLAAAVILEFITRTNMCPGVDIDANPFATCSIQSFADLGFRFEQRDGAVLTNFIPATIKPSGVKLVDAVSHLTEMEMKYKETYGSLVNVYGGLLLEYGSEKAFQACTLSGNGRLTVTPQERIELNNCILRAYRTIHTDTIFLPQGVI